MYIYTKDVLNDLKDKTVGNREGQIVEVVTCSGIVNSGTKKASKTLVKMRLWRAEE